ncbi:MAG: FAD-dependent monooxygenase [Gemmatimonadales bacterium]
MARSGVAVRIIDKIAEPGTTSRALAVQARTLEFYRQLDLADEVVALGLKFAAVNLWTRGKRAGRVEFGDIGVGLSPFPYLLIFPQDEHERFLIEHLIRVGVTVERPSELVALEQNGDGVQARIRRGNGVEEVCGARYAVGCDGAKSLVRDALELSFPGGTYQQRFYVADARVGGPVANHELHVALDDADFLAVFPLKGDRDVRLIGTVQTGLGQSPGALTWNDVSRHAMQRMQITVDRLDWFSTYHVHHRVAPHFRRGRVFLAGDAAHIHSPVGAQGMNTGIGDAVNLAWKLADVVRGGADASLLDSYEAERIAFARRLVATTDRVFTFVTRNGPIARIIRFRIVPALAPWLMNRTSVRRFMFRTVSQIRIHYRPGMLSEGHAGAVRGGDRVPWVRPEGNAAADNFTPLTSLRWQVHVYGTPSPGLAKACDDRGLPLHVFSWQPSMHRVGLARNAGYLVRPDGHVAMAGVDAASIGRYLDIRGLQPRTG